MKKECLGRPHNRRVRIELSFDEIFEWYVEESCDPQ